MSDQNVLITFLGAGSKDRQKRYREANYQFGDGLVEKTRFFGLSLCKQLKVDRLVILGTSGSIWDVLLIEQDIFDVSSDTIENLIEAADANHVSKSLLDNFAPVLSRNLGIEVSLDIIPYGESSEGQREIVSIMSAYAADANAVHIDITHGLRHLPIISLASAQVISAALVKRIAGIHYGALELTKDGITPVVSLSGLLEIQDWSSAFAAFEHTRDYGIFIPLLRDKVPQKALDHLRMASFSERLNDTGKSREQLRKFNQANAGYKPKSALEKLFFPELEKRISWVLGGSLAERQINLSRMHLENGDYLRSVIMAFEAWVSAAVKRRSGQETSYPQRKKAADALAEQSNDAKRETFKTLRQIRNAVTHGVRPDTRAAQQAISNPTVMQAVLVDTLAEIDRYIRSH